MSIARMQRLMGQSAALLGLLSGIWGVTANAAEVVSLRQLQETSKLPASELAGNLLKMNGLDSLRPVKTENTTEMKYQKLQQYFAGVKVYGYQTIVNRTKAGVRIHGYRVNGIEKDVADVESTYTPAEAVALAKAEFRLHGKNAKQVAAWSFDNEEVEKIIQIDANKKAVLAYRVSFFADSILRGYPARPVYLFNAKTKAYIGGHDRLMFSSSYARGPGGNEKTGRYEYGYLYPELVVEDKGSGRCTLDSTNVETVDMRHEDPDGAASGGMGGGGGTAGGTYNPFEFQCGRNEYKAINGAYSPLNDGHFFGNVVFNMYKEWYNQIPIPTKLRVRVHYAKNFSNAFWDGKQMSFGDGGEMETQDASGKKIKIDIFHPLVTLDVMAHEVSHGFTQTHSNLEYIGEPGGINEAFSDMAGEAAEFYARKQNDFLVGYEVIKSNPTVDGKPWGQSALRYMDDPSKDGKSAKDMAGYKWDFMCDLCIAIADGVGLPKQLCPAFLADKCMDVHHSSGIYNRAFYLLATTQGWDTRKAFAVFVLANLRYWSPTTTFADGAKGAKDAASDLGYDVKAVVTAFSSVGIKI